MSPDPGSRSARAPTDDTAQPPVTCRSPKPAGPRRDLGASSQSRRERRRVTLARGARAGLCFPRLRNGLSVFRRKRFSRRCCSKACPSAPGRDTGSPSLAESPGSCLTGTGGMRSDARRPRVVTPGEVGPGRWHCRCRRLPGSSRKPVTPTCARVAPRNTTNVSRSRTPRRCSRRHPQFAAHRVRTCARRSDTPPSETGARARDTRDHLRRLTDAVAPGWGLPQAPAGHTEVTLWLGLGDRATVVVHAGPGTNRGVQQAGGAGTRPRDTVHR